MSRTGTTGRDRREEAEERAERALARDEPGTGPVRIVLHGAQIEDADVREVVQELRNAGREVEVRVTWEEGDAERFAREIAGAASVVVAVGGDGTISEVASGVAAGTGARAAALGVVPMGTGNDFATAAGIPLDEVREALLLAVSGEASSVDLVRCGDRRFLNMATGGPGTKVTAETPDGLKRTLGGLSYALAGIAQLSAFEPQAGTIRGEDLEWSGDFLALAVGNGRNAAGGVTLCPQAVIDDGLLDLRVIPHEGSGAGALLLESLLRGQDTVLDEASWSHRSPWFEIETREPLHVHLDGEPVEARHYRFEVEPGALRVVLPKDSPLLSG